MSASFDDAEFDALGGPDTDPLGPDGAGSPSAAVNPMGMGESNAVLSGDAPPAAPATIVTMPCPIQGCGRRVHAGTVGDAFRALQAHLEAAHGLTPREPDPEPRPVAQLVLPEPDADLAALFDAPIDPQTGEAVIRIPDAS